MFDRKEYFRKYREAHREELRAKEQTPERKASLAKWRAANRDKIRALAERYIKSEKGKAARERYRKSEKGKAVIEKYKKSEKGQITIHKNQSKRPDARLLRLADEPDTLYRDDEMDDTDLSDMDFRIAEQF